MDAPVSGSIPVLNSPVQADNPIQKMTNDIFNCMFTFISLKHPSRLSTAPQTEVYSCCTYTAHVREGKTSIL